jgi:DNA sulfur modification protein DndE
LGTLLVGCNQSSNENTQINSNTVDAAVVELVTQAYLFSYPAMTMNYTHKISANVEANNGWGKAPINQWGNMHQFPKAGFTDVVRPNLDTFYSVIYADLSDGPLYIEIPATERYYLMPILNAYGDVIESLGTRTTGQGKLKIALLGPNFNGNVDSDLTTIRSTTNLNWLLGRISAKNNDDGKRIVSKFQSKLVAKPLSERNNPQYEAPKGIINQQYVGLTPMDVVDEMDIVQYLNESMALLEENPVYVEDAPLLAKLQQVGFKAGGSFDLNQFNKATQAAIKNVPQGVAGAFAKMTANPPTGNLQNGWNVITSGLGEYGTEYFLRAYVTKVGYGANQVVDAIYPNAAVDTEGRKFNGSHKYVLNFPADKLPPVDGFWSLTLYNTKGFLVDNVIDRYNLGSMKDLTYNEDGSLDLLIQFERPENNESNWLPSPPAGEDFELTFRMYYPKDVVINRTYILPGVKRVK